MRHKRAQSMGRELADNAIMDDTEPDWLARQSCEDVFGERVLPTWIVPGWRTRGATTLRDPSFHEAVLDTSVDDHGTSSGSDTDINPNPISTNQRPLGESNACVDTNDAFWTALGRSMMPVRDQLNTERTSTLTAILAVRNERLQVLGAHIPHIYEGIVMHQP